MVMAAAYSPSLISILALLIAALQLSDAFAYRQKEKISAIISLHVFMIINYVSGSKLQEILPLQNLSAGC
jgi:hypothetical protein